MGSKRACNVTVLIPTKNRAHLLEKTLRYYNSVDFGGKILIGDASDNKNKVPDVLEQFPHLDCDVRWMKRDPVQTVLPLLVEIVTPYVIVTGDDDFLLMDGLEVCTELLAQDASFIAVSGKAVWMKPKDDGVHLLPCYLPEILEELPGQRLINHLSQFKTTAFCVFRIEAKRYTHKFVKKHYDPKSALECELIPSALATWLGRIGMTDRTLLVRTAPKERAVAPGLLGLITRPTWSQEYQQFIDVLAKEVGESLATAAIDVYLQSVIDTKGRNATYRPGWLRDLIKQIPYAVNVHSYIQMRRLLGQDYNEVQRIIQWL